MQQQKQSQGLPIHLFLTMMTPPILATAFARFGGVIFKLS
jgi:hypothetical protein